MRARKFEEILEECIDAGVAGRRSVEQSLALYPAEAGRLEPLLRTALRLTRNFHSVIPSSAIQQRGHARFLSAARDRRNVRQLARGFERRGLLAGFFRNPAFSGVAAAASVTVITVAVAGGVMLSGSGSSDGGSPPAVVEPNDTPGSLTLATLNQQIESLKNRANSGSPIDSTDDIAAINKTLDDLASEVAQGTHDPSAASAVQDAIVLLEQIVDANPGLGDDENVQETLDSGRNLASALGGEPTAAATPTSPVLTDVPTAVPTPVITQAPTPAPTAPPTPTPSPTPVPAPSETAASRFPSGFGN